MRYRFYYQWRKCWARFNGSRGFGRLAARLALWQTAPYQGRAFLADFYPRGYIAPSAYLRFSELTLGEHVFVGDRVILTIADKLRGEMVLGDRVHLYGDTFIQLGSGGTLTIGEDTHIQPGCHLRAFVSGIEIGRRVEIASGCAFYSFDHGMEAGMPVMDRPLTSKGPIVIGDGAWLGHGVTVLSGVRIGAGAVIAAGSVVTRDIPPDMIAAGVPARVIKPRPQAAAAAEAAVGA